MLVIGAASPPSSSAKDGAAAPVEAAGVRNEAGLDHERRLDDDAWQAIAGGDLPKPSYRLGIFPYLPALTIDRLYSPVAEAFSFELDRLVKLRTKTTFENFESAMASESYDIIFVHPFFLLDAMDHYGYLPLARLAKPLSAVLAVKDHSPARALDDLVGGTIGLPPRLAAVSSLIKAALVQAGLRPGLDLGIRHFRNHASCLDAVIAGSVAACGLPSFSLSEGHLAAGDRAAAPSLRVVFEATPVSHFAFAVHRRVPEAERRKLEALLLGWADAAGVMVAAMGLTSGFVRALPEDYDMVRTHRARLQTLAQR
jgi:ABC-type phosphate/phosphonate transport system substrate-binding protein